MLTIKLKLRFSPFTAEFFSIKFIYSIISIPGILKFLKYKHEKKYIILGSLKTVFYNIRSTKNI